MKAMNASRHLTTTLRHARALVADSRVAF